MSGPTRRSTERWRLAGVFLVGLGLIWLVATALVYSTTEAPVAAIPTEDQFWGYDYRAYRNAAVRLGEEGSLYQQELLAGPYRPGSFGLYMYAPPLGVSILPALELGVSESTWLWYGVHVLALVAACALLPVRSLIRLFSFAVALFSYAVVKDMALGNVSVLLLLPTVMAWRWLDRPLGSIGQAIAISIRPTLGILVVWQLLRRRWRAALWTIGAGLILIAATLPFVGIAGYVDYLTVLRNMSDVSGVPYNHDIGSVALEWGLPEAAASVALLGGYAFAIVVMILSLRRDREVGFMVTLTGSMLLAPLLWDHYLALLLLPAAFLAQRGHPVALLLPMVGWIPVLLEPWTFLYPVIVMVMTVLPFGVRDRAATDEEPATTHEPTVPTSTPSAFAP